jgi:hypothetical protein
MRTRLTQQEAEALQAKLLKRYPIHTPSTKLERVDPAKPTLRQKTGPKLNITEGLFLRFLQETYANDKHATIGVQDVTLILANGVRYTPDMRVAWVNANAEATTTFYEVKGFMRDDAAVKLKVAASAFPEYRFRLVRLDKNSPTGWRIEEVKP